MIFIPEHIRLVRSAEEAELTILKLANEKGILALAVGTIPDPTMQTACEHAIEQEWIRLIDVGPVAAAPGIMFRVFKLTHAGRQRKQELEKSRTA